MSLNPFEWVTALLAEGHLAGSQWMIRDAEKIEGVKMGDIG